MSRANQLGVATPVFDHQIAQKTTIWFRESDFEGEIVNDFQGHGLTCSRITGLKVTGEGRREFFVQIDVLIGETHIFAGHGYAIRPSQSFTHVEDKFFIIVTHLKTL
ncbi:MAG: hypothetical protein JW384_00822 [Nitrosomonadaceae bacterium]|nr:hypothetical protein [Nitrosomonadaceae bacterium]